MKQYVGIFDEIKANSGRLAKEELLRKYADVPGFKDILRFVYDTMIVTGLAKRKIEKELSDEVCWDFNNIFEVMAYVKDNNTGSDSIVRTVQNFIKKLETEEERELAKSILIKDLPVGISRTTLNKVYGSDFIKKYSVMLAGKFDPTKKQFDGDFAATLKLDGNRATFFVYEDEIKVFTRSGKEIEGLVELEKEFSNLPKNWVFDGELIAENPDNLPSKDLFNLTQTIVRKKGIKEGLNFVVFDALPVAEFNEGKSKKVYKDRMMDLDQIFYQCVEDDMHIKRVPSYFIGNDLERVAEILTEVESEGYEGLMLNSLNGYYETKRTKSLLKVKTFHTADLKCIGVKEDIRGGRCGSLTVEYKGYRVDVAGLKDELKELYWKHPDLVVGKIIEVKYFEESSNAQGGISLRFPSYVRIREDKTEADVSYA
ncbi:RNA ligase family protein [Bacillus wiedmannii]|uniref:ATP-dependent DNA ligase n=1 Tax=Bacillus wiedmannii TaxID=1890302 RepID=UPI000BF23068|nr:RNA ligase family protein [Bacillus wiedmannii]PEN61632.1 ATP-dependent DNA ligase [Bacillus wiedmannii]